MLAYYDSPIGLICIREFGDAIVSVSFVLEGVLVDRKTQCSNLLLEAKKQLSEYFHGRRFAFDLPIRLKGTDFQEKSWAFLKTIPYAQTVSYAEQAMAIGHPRAYRAVGSANGHNPIAILVPCHRVISSHNTLSGYAYGLPIKQYLLDLEKKSLQKK